MDDSNSLESLVEVIKASKDYVYKVENICKACDYRIHVYKWVKAEDCDIDIIKKEIEKAYKLAFNKCGSTKRADSSIDPYIVSEVVKLFKEHFQVTDCGHLYIGERRESYLEYSHVHEKMPFEERLKNVGIGMYISRENGEEKLKELTEAYEKIRTKIDQLCRDELILTLVKKDVDANLYKNEVGFLCKSCEFSFVDRYEIPDSYPCEGARCIFKRFAAEIAQRIKSSLQFIDAYNFGVLKGKNGNIIISQGDLNQPPKNVMMFNPSLILCINNFFSNKRVIRYPYSRGFLPVNKELSSINASAFKSAMDFLAPTLAYDCETDQHAHVAIEMIAPSISRIIEKLSSIEYTVKPTEKAYKAAHDRIMEICRDIGLEFGFKPETEYRVGTERIDVAWLERTSGALEVAIEVEFGASVTGDLWKLCESHPKLAVLIVKGSYYKNACDHATRSEIIKRLRQKLMVLDISGKTYTIIKGEKLLILPRDN